MQNLVDKLMILIGVLLWASASAFAAHSKVAQDLQGTNPGSTVDVIVQYRHTATASQHQKILAKGGRFKRDLSVIKAGHYSIPASVLNDLAKDPEVLSITPDRVVRGALDLSSAAVSATTAAQNYGVTGAGIGVAVLDSGISGNPDIAGPVIVYQQSFVGGDPHDHYGHGTHVAGIIAGSGSASSCKQCDRTFKGIAPGVSLVNLRVLDQTGTGTDSNIIAGIQTAISLKSKYNIRVINLSMGRPVFESYTADPLCQAVEAAWKAGIVVVVAAGNNGRDNSQGTNGYGTITAPGNDPYVITVGAMKTMGTSYISDDRIASYSSKGPTAIDHIVKPDLVAPGNRVNSLQSSDGALKSQYPGNRTLQGVYETGIATGAMQTASNVYFVLSGTSMATPVVSSAAALLLQANPAMTPDQVKARLMKTAYKSFPSSSVAVDPSTGISYTSYYDVFTVGAGYVDIAAALANNDWLSGFANSPAAQFNGSSHQVSMLPSPGSLLGTGLVWGTGVVWGTNSVSSSGLVWGTGVVWGTGIASTASGLVWGTSLVWGTGLVSGTQQAASEACGIAIVGEQ